MQPGRRSSLNAPWRSFYEDPKELGECFYGKDHPWGRHHPDQLGECRRTTLTLADAARTEGAPWTRLEDQGRLLRRQGPPWGRRLEDHLDQLGECRRRPWQCSQEEGAPWTRLEDQGRLLRQGPPWRRSPSPWPTWGMQKEPLAMQPGRRSSLNAPWRSSRKASTARTTLRSPSPWPTWGMQKEPLAMQPGRRSSLNAYLEDLRGLLRQGPPWGRQDLDQLGECRRSPWQCSQAEGAPWTRLEDPGRLLRQGPPWGRHYPLQLGECRRSPWQCSQEEGAPWEGAPWTLRLEDPWGRLLRQGPPWGRHHPLQLGCCWVSFEHVCSWKDAAWEGRWDVPQMVWTIASSYHQGATGVVGDRDSKGSCRPMFVRVSECFVLLRRAPKQVIVTIVHGSLPNLRNS